VSLDVRTVNRPKTSVKSPLSAFPSARGVSGNVSRTTNSWTVGSKVDGERHADQFREIASLSIGAPQTFA